MPDNLWTNHTSLNYLLGLPTREVEQAAENALAVGAEAVVLVLIGHPGARASDRLGVSTENSRSTYMLLG